MFEDLWKEGCQKIIVDWRNNMYEFSIIIPIYNEGEAFKKNVDFLYEEDYSNFELILVDDGSLDCSGKVCDNICAEHKNCKVIHKINGGSVDARQAGINMAEGKYIVFIDADDSILPGYFSCLCSAVKHKADIYLLNSLYSENDSKEVYIKNANFAQGYVKKDVLDKKILFGNDTTVWDKIYVRKIIKDNNITFPQKITYADDVYINLRYSRFVKEIYCQNTAKYLHINSSPTSVVKHHLSITRLNEMNIVYKEACDYIDDMMISNEVKNAFFSSYIFLLARIISDLYLNGTKVSELKKIIVNLNVNKPLFISNYNRIIGKVYAYLIYKGNVILLSIVMKIRDFLKKKWYHLCL